MKDLVQHTRTQSELKAEMEAIATQHKGVIDEFHKLFYACPFTHGMTYFENVPLLKSPSDLWVYQEMLWDLRPTLIIETGTACGGSALFFARTLDRIGGQSMVVTIDIDAAPEMPKHRRITPIIGSSVDPEIVRAMRACASTHPRVMVVLDSDHSQEHVMAELEAYADLVTPGQFLVVEDTNICGRPVEIDWKGGPGPGEAVDAWWPAHPEFETHPMTQRYLMTFHTWLRRVEDGENEA